MAGWDQTIDQGFVVRCEAIIEGGEIVLPLRFSAGSGNDGRDQTVVQHPADREIDRARSALLSMTLDFLREAQGFLAPFSLHDAAILPRCTASLRGLRFIRV